MSNSQTVLPPPIPCTVEYIHERIKRSTTLDQVFASTPLHSEIWYDLDCEPHPQQTRKVSFRVENHDVVLDIYIGASDFDPTLETIGSIKIDGEYALVRHVPHTFMDNKTWDFYPNPTKEQKKNAIELMYRLGFQFNVYVDGFVFRDGQYSTQPQEPILV